MAAIDSIFADSHTQQKLIVGSIKPNVGHLEACAALVSIIKVVESLERGLVPPQLHYSTPNPKIKLDSTVIPTSTTSWPRSRNGVHRAAVNSFGFGGTNGHVVLEAVPIVVSEPVSLDRPFLFKVSAVNETSLAALANSYADYIDRRRPVLGDLAYTLLARRSTFKRTLFLTSSSHGELIEKLRTWNDTSKLLTRRPSSNPRIGFVFTGQGAQW
jgi:acyl transferase domain-containing protein